jgi:hypothetical protein
MSHSSGGLHANAPSWLSHHLSTQRRNPSYVLVKVHDECKNEAILLDIWKAQGRSGSQGRRALAGGRWREKINVDFAGISVPSSRRYGTIRQKERDGYNIPGLFKHRENLCLYGSSNATPRPPRNEGNITVMFMHLFMRFPSPCVPTLRAKRTT